jgi:hypothetical protein
MRYVLPLAPALCVFAALLVLFVEARLTAFYARLATALASALCLLALLGTIDVVRPFARTDARDAAAAWMKNNAASATVALASDRPWFWSVPLSPQDAPPGSSISIAEALAQSTIFGATSSLSTLAFSSETLSRDKPQYVVMSELEWRDKERLSDPNYRISWRNWANSMSCSAHFLLRRASYRDAISLHTISCMPIRKCAFIACAGRAAKTRSGPMPGNYDVVM